MDSDAAEQPFLSFAHALRILRRRALVLVLCIVLLPAVALAYSLHKTKQYTATASLVFNDNQLSQQVAGLQAVGNNVDQQSQQDTDVQITKLGNMAAQTARALGSGLTGKAIASSLSITAVGDTSVVDIAAVSPSAARAATIANTYSRIFVAEQQSSDQQYFRSALSLVNKELGALSPQQRVSAAGLALEDRAQSLGILAQLQSGNVQIAQLAKVPTSASSPKIVRDAILGGFLGLLLGLALAFLWERVDRRISEVDDFARVYQLPLLGVVPRAASLARSRRERSNTVGVLPAADAEAFHLIRAHLSFFSIDRPIRTLLVGSASSGEGKSTVALNLAAAAASTGSRVMLLELDLRFPVLARAVGINREPGVCDVLVGSVPPGVAIQSIDVGAPLVGGPSGPALDVLVAGGIRPPNPAQLLESRAMQSLLDRMKSAYDLVVIDTPPLVVVADAFALLPKVDGIVIVGRVGHSRRDIAQRLHRTLAAADAPLLGVIANGAKAAGDRYGYAYAEASRHAAQTLVLRPPPSLQRP